MFLYSNQPESPVVQFRYIQPVVVMIFMLMEQKYYHPVTVLETVVSYV